MSRASPRWDAPTDEAARVARCVRWKYGDKYDIDLKSSSANKWASVWAMTPQGEEAVFANMDKGSGSNVSVYEYKKLAQAGLGRIFSDNEVAKARREAMSALPPAVSGKVMCNVSADTAFCDARSYLGWDEISCDDYDRVVKRLRRIARTALTRFSDELGEGTSSEAHAFSRFRKGLAERRKWVARVWG